MSNNTEQLLAGARAQFDLGKQISCRAYGSGHINDTYLIVSEVNGRQVRYILQRMNGSIFKNADELMENVVNVTRFLQKKIRDAGGDPMRETLSVIGTKDGANFYRDQNGDGWRVYHFVENTFSLDAVRTPEDFYESALAFGRFQRMLADYPADTLHETIASFHDTRKRLARFREVLAADPLGRARAAEAETRFILEREKLAFALEDQREAGTLPLRVTHNDTKLNNILMDAETGRGICIIDLDTVMPGLSAYDFGDAIRFGASTAAEDETDLSKVSMNIDLYALYTKGYIEGCGGALTREEILALPLGAKVITFENGIRFLTDYLEGDVYYKIHRAGQNLDRARTQLKLVADMESKWDRMLEIAESYSNS